MDQLVHSGSPLLRAALAIFETSGLELPSFIQSHRADGLSWERVARKLVSVTDGVIDVTGETVRRWAVELDREDAA